MRIGRQVPVSLLIAALVAACSGGGGGSSGTGTVTLSLMDRPVDGVTEVNITISEIWIKPQDGEAIQLAMTSAPLSVNLLELNDENNAAVLVNNAVVRVGRYNWVELKIEDDDISESNALTDVGGMVPIDIDVPSGKIRLVSGFEVGENEGVRFLFDWDVRKGLTDPVGRDVYLLRPAFRIIDVDELSAISGVVELGTVCPGLGNSEQPIVYVFADDVTPDDIDDIAEEPVTTADVDLTVSPAAYRAVVDAGVYTVALLCDSADDTDEDDALEFLQPDVALAVSVTADAPATDVDFTARTPF
jgi:hypothetical protein